MLEIRGLRKTFGSLVAVNDVSFTIEPGEILGLLGPNGAGNTTTVSMISGLLAPDAGEIRIDGRPLRGDTDPIKRRIGLVLLAFAALFLSIALARFRWEEA